MENTASPKRGRPPGSIRPNGRLSKTEHQRLAHWQAWWLVRPGGRPSAAGLAKQMEQAAPTVADYAAGRRVPGVAALSNLEALCGPFGYAPLTSDHQFL